MVCNCCNHHDHDHGESIFDLENKKYFKEIIHCYLHWLEMVYNAKQNFKHLHEITKDDNHNDNLMYFNILSEQNPLLDKDLLKNHFKLDSNDILLLESICKEVQDKYDELYKNPSLSRKKELEKLLIKLSNTFIFELYCSDHQSLLQEIRNIHILIVNNKIDSEKGYYMMLIEYLNYMQEILVYLRLNHLDIYNKLTSLYRLYKIFYIIL